jgi:hypothetical protein
MNYHKQDDHVFNKSLQKMADELLDIVHEEMDDDARFQKTQGAAERIRPLKDSLASIHEGFAQPAFALTVKKRNPAAVADANSLAHGLAKRQMVFAFRQFVTSLKWLEIRSGEPATPARDAQLDFHAGALRTANLLLRLEFVKWLETAIDHEAEALLPVQSPASAPLLTQGRAHLLFVRDQLIKLLPRYMPD